MKPGKRFFHIVLTLAALTAGVGAQTQTASNITPVSPAEAPAKAPSAPPITAADVQALKDALAAQQAEIELLKQQLQRQQQWQESQSAVSTAIPASPASRPAPARVEVASAEPVSPSPLPQEPSAAQNVQAGSSDERIRNLERQVKGLGPISFSGDVRLRAGPSFGGPADESLERMRERVRVRFNAQADLGSQFRTGITLASGDINDPISTNQTLTGFYTRKPIALDQAFVQFTPKQFKNLTLVGGKFRYPWYNTELTWDKDLNPEGAAEILAFNLSTPVLKRFALVGFELPFAEVAGTVSGDKRITQQITYGGQLQTTWQIVPHVTLNAYTGFYDFRGADSIALALARAGSKNPQTPLTGLLPLQSANGVQNSVYTTTASTVITVNGTSYPTGVTAITNSQFASKFQLFDTIARLDIDTGHKRAPLSFIGDYVQNMGACGNLANLAPAPANTSTTTYNQTVNAPCAAKQRRGYWMEGRVGRLQDKGDLQFGYTHIYIEREAVLSNFNYSDIRQGSNVTQHRFDLFYQFDRNVQLGAAALVGRPLGTTEPWLTRLQFDTIYIF